MKPNGGGDKIPGNLEKKIVADLGSVAKMKEDFIQAGVTQFGSGWCWLAVKDGKIVVTKTPNGENPLVHGGKPILGCDVWEHSYYIDYRNRRPDYLKAFVDHLVNWEYVAEDVRRGDEVIARFAADGRALPRRAGDPHDAASPLRGGCRALAALTHLAIRRPRSRCHRNPPRPYVRPSRLDQRTWPSRRPSPLVDAAEPVLTGSLSRRSRSWASSRF